MKSTITPGMYEVYKIGNDKYQVHSSVPGIQAMEGTALGIMTYMTSSLGFDPQEVEFGFIDMIQKDNDAANFGMYGGFIYSFKKSAKYGKVA